MERRLSVILATASLVLVACSDAGGSGDDPPTLDRIDGPAVVDPSFDPFVTDPTVPPAAPASAPASAPGVTRGG